MTTAIKINQNDGFKQTLMVGGETTAPFDFPIFDEDHIRLLQTDTAGVITELVKGTDFTVPAGSVNNQAGGNLNLSAATFPSGATAAHKFTALLNSPEERVTDFPVGGDFRAETVNLQLDLLTQQVQQLRRDLDKAFRLPEDSTATAVLPGAVSGKHLGWDGAGNLTNQDAITGIPNPMTTLDDILKAAAGGGPVRQAKGSNNTLWSVDKDGLLAYQSEAGLPLDRMGIRGLIVTRNSGTPSSKCDMKVERIPLINTAGLIWPIRTSLTVAITDSGANGLDTGAEAASTFYFLHFILNPTALATGTTDSTTSSKLEDSTADFVTDGVKIGDIVWNTTDDTKTYVTVVDDLNTLTLADDFFVSGENYKIYAAAGLLSISSTAPTLPSGYTFHALASVVKNNASFAFLDFLQIADDYQYLSGMNDATPSNDVTNVLSFGAATSATSVNCSGFIPPNSRRGYFLARYVMDDSTPGTLGQGHIVPAGAGSGFAESMALSLLAQVASLDIVAEQYMWVALDSSQDIEYAISGTPDGTEVLSIWVVGFKFIFNA